jgi:PleD family two-component response regulator
MDQDLVDGMNLLQNDQAKKQHNNTDFKGKILIADDQQLNIAALKINMAEIGLLESSFFFIDGQQVIDYVEAELDGLLWDDSQTQ